MGVMDFRRLFRLPQIGTHHPYHHHHHHPCIPPLLIVLGSGDGLAHVSMLLHGISASQEEVHRGHILSPNDNA